MNLTFNKINDVFVSEFSVTSDFNLHVERSKGGSFTIFQRSSDGGNYGEVYYQEKLDKIKAIDYDFSALIYPKYIKIVSEVEPTYAAITTDGEVTEIKTQSKEIEITSNGITNITPDSGFAYLDRVSVKTNVAQSGSESKSAMKYYSCLPDYFLQEVHEVTLVDSVKALLQEDGSTIIAPESVYNWGSFSPIVIAVAIDTENRRCYVDGEWITMKEYALRFDGFNTDTHYEITEEEYYRIPDAWVIKNEVDIASVYESICSRLTHGGILPEYLDYFTSSTNNVPRLNIPVQFWSRSHIGVVKEVEEWRAVAVLNYFTVKDLYTNDTLNGQEYFCKNITCLGMATKEGAYAFFIGKAELEDGTTKYFLPLITF